MPNEKSLPGFLVKLLAGSLAGAVYELVQSPQGKLIVDDAKKLFVECKAALKTPEGEKLIEELRKIGEKNA